MWGGGRRGLLKEGGWAGGCEEWWREVWWVYDGCMREGRPGGELRLKPPDAADPFPELDTATPSWPPALPPIPAAAPIPLLKPPLLLLMDPPCVPPLLRDTAGLWWLLALDEGEVALTAVGAGDPGLLSEDGDSGSES
jgi:hypothetical protein